jgi:hypothetical protein
VVTAPDRPAVPLATDPDVPLHRLTLDVDDGRREVAAALVLAAGAEGLAESPDAIEAWFAHRPPSDHPALTRLAALGLACCAGVLWVLLVVLWLMPHWRVWLQKKA